MIAVVETAKGYTIAKDGQVIARNLNRADADDLHAQLGTALRPLSTAVSPAKARLMRYAAGVASVVTK